MTDKPAKPVRPPAHPRGQAQARGRVPRREREPSHAEISERAYFIALEQGGADELGNWLRAERELAAA